jgi:hypothetical protein
MQWLELCDHKKVDLPSRLWSHPTLWQYVKTGLRRGYGRSESPQ